MTMLLETSGLLLPLLFGYLVVSEQNSFTVFSSFKRKIMTQMKYLREIVLHYNKKLVDFVRTYAGLPESLGYCDQHLHIMLLSPLQTVISCNPHK